VGTLNCKEQAKKIYVICIKTKKNLSYEEVLNSLGYKKGVSGQAIRFGLELVLIACAVQGLPILTSIVVNKSTGYPSAGNYPDGSWKKEAQKVFNYKEWPNVDKINWKDVWNNRVQLSKDYGTPGYWSR
jgi:hypothetical protein